MTLHQGHQVEAMTEVLIRFQWRRSGGVPGVFDVWEAEDGRGQIMLPLDPERPDFERLFSVAQRQVSERLGDRALRYLELIEMSQEAALDQTQWQKQTTVAAGLIPWSQGELLYASARSMLLASAKSTREQKMYHGNGGAFIAKRFMDDCFMGQTAVGSFIITAHTPADKKFHFTKRSEEEARFATPSQIEATSGGEIMNTFQHALEVTRECLDEYKKRPTLEVFVEGVPYGLSYEFVKALGEAVRDGDAAIEVLRGVSIASNREHKEFTFDASEAPLLANVSDRFAQAYEPTDVTLIGEVILLSHASSSAERVIRLVADPGSYVRKARVKLDAQQYALALEAHSADQKLSVSGRLEREGNLHWMYSARDVQIVGNVRGDIEEPALFDAQRYLSP